MHLGDRAAKGAAVTILGQAVRILLQFASVVVLARLLTPLDYGLLALVLVVIGVGEIFRDFGLSSAAIQSSTLSLNQRTNLFWLNTAIGGALSAIVFLGANAAALILDQPELRPIAQFLAFTFLLNGMATQYRAGLNRSMRFGALAVSEVTAQACGLCAAVSTALLGWGYWALVAQQLTQVTSMLFSVVILGHWLPGRPRRGDPLVPFLRFGWNLMGTQLINYVSNNLDSIIIGLRFGPSSLGIYSRAFQLLMNPLNQLRTPATTVALPVLSRLQDQPVRSGQYVKRGQIVLGYTIIPVLAFAAGTADPLVSLFLGDKWEAVPPIFAFMALAGAMQTVSFVSYWIYLSRGLTRDLFQYTLVSVTIKATCIISGSHWGITGVAAGYALAPTLSWPISLWWLSRRTPLPLRDLWLGAFRILGLGIAAAAVAFLITRSCSTIGSVLQLVVAFAGCLGIYAFAALVIQRIRSDIFGVVDVLRRVLRRQ